MKKEMSVFVFGVLFVVFMLNFTLALDLTISSNTNDYNLFTRAGSPSSAININLVIQPAVQVASTTISHGAIYGSSNFPAGSTVAIINNGVVYGLNGIGGVGGKGAAGCHSGRYAGAGGAGGAGGNAIDLIANTVIINNGRIWSGGGGGGGGGAAGGGSSGSYRASPGGSGGGGSTGGAGGFGGGCSCSSGYFEPNGNVGSSSNYGSVLGGVAVNQDVCGDLGYPSGKGGAVSSGMNGEAGQSMSCYYCSGGGVGGLAGNSIKTNGYSLQINKVFNILGPILGDYSICTQELNTAFCTRLGKECGVWPDGCGGTLFCWADTYPYSFSYESSWYASENKETRGVATDGNFMWVVDRRTSMVYKYTMNGTYTEESFNSGIVDGQGGITTDGNFIWILDRVVDSVRKYTMNGTYTGEFWFPAGDVYGNKDVFGITTDGNFIWVVDGNFEGEHIRKYTMGGVYLGEYWDYSGPNFVDITTDGNYFWIINEGNAILRYDFEGVRESEYSQVLADWEAGYQNAPLGITTYGDSLYVVGQREWAPSSNVWVYNYTKLWGEYRCDYGKMCSIDGTCISEIPYWVDMKGNAIGQTIGKQAQIGDTVLMIYKDKAGGDYDFIIKEKDVINNDDIRTVTGVFNFGSDLAAKWTITKEDFDLGNPSSDLGLEGNTEELYFTVDNKISDELWVDKNSINNILPSTQIINPKYKEVYVINEATGKTTDIPFKQISSDPDDDLKLTWEFGDGTNQSFENIKTGLGNTSHSYTTPGTKTIRLTAQEMSPRAAAQSASDTTEIYVYKEGVIVFAIITQPNPDEIQEINSRFVKINASATHAVNCSYNLAKCQASAPSPGDCITYNDKITNYPIYCYRFPQAAQDKMKIEWTFDNNPNKLTGEYGAGKTKVVGFVKIFDEPGKHTLNLKASYTTP